MENASAQTLFVMPVADASMDAPADPATQAPPRLRRVDRQQVRFVPCTLEETLEADHPARLVWALVSSWDLSRFLDVIRARGQAPGRAAVDPVILISLWLYAYSRHVSNGRELDRLCERDDAFRWICGGVSMNYHTLNDFRVGYQAALDDLLTQMVATLLSEGAISVERVAFDGTRQRAAAGRGSFQTQETIEKHLAEARAHVEAMKTQALDPNASLQRQQALRRAARERVEHLEQAAEEVKKVAQAKARQKEKPSKHQPAKASITDPEVRQMRMPGGGTAPALNTFFAVSVEGRAIVGVNVTNDGSDVPQGEPMRQQVEQRTGQKVNESLIDGGFIGLENVDAAAEARTTVYAPVPKPRKEGVDRHQPKRGDSQALAEWRARMGTAAAKEIYKQRASTVETANAECKTYRGLVQFLVRGIDKVRCVALWSALAYNLIHFGARLIA
jgi:transposase